MSPCRRKSPLVISRTPGRSPPSAKKRRQAAARAANLQAAARAREGLDALRVQEERQIAQQRRDEAKFKRELKEAKCLHYLRPATGLSYSSVHEHSNALSPFRVTSLRFGSSCDSFDSSRQSANDARGSSKCEKPSQQSDGSSDDARYACAGARRILVCFGGSGLRLRRSGQHSGQHPGRLGLSPSLSE